VGCLLQVFALQLTLFGLLAWFVHIHPILPLDGMRFSEEDKGRFS